MEPLIPRDGDFQVDFKFKSTFENLTLSQLSSFKFFTKFAYVVLVVTTILPERESLEYRQIGCSGTFIQPDVVLTAASCVVLFKNQKPRPKDTAVIGRTFDAVEISSIDVHPKYEPKEQNYNLALLKTDRDVDLTSFGILPNSSMTFGQAMNKCIIIGYGDLLVLSFEQFQILNLNETRVVEVDCRHSNHPVLCVDFPDLLPCQGDMGAPIMCGDEIYAIYTPKYSDSIAKCHRFYGSIFTPIFPIGTEWVEKVLLNDETEALSILMANPALILLFALLVLAILGTIYCVVTCGFKDRVERVTRKPADNTTSTEDSEDDSNV